LYWFWLISIDFGWFCLFLNGILLIVIDVCWVWVAFAFFQLCLTHFFDWVWLDSGFVQLCFMEFGWCWLDFDWFCVLFDVVLLILILIRCWLILFVFQLCSMDVDRFWLDVDWFSMFFNDVVFSLIDFGWILIDFVCLPLAFYWFWSDSGWFCFQLSLLVLTNFGCEGWFCLVFNVVLLIVMDVGEILVDCVCFPMMLSRFWLTLVRLLIDFFCCIVFDWLWL